MSHLLQLPNELHFEILVWLVIRCFNELVENQSLVDELADLNSRYDVIAGLQPEPEEDEKRYVIAFLLLVFTTTADLNLEPYLAASSTARLFWRSHRRAILHRAATECLKVLTPRVKAIRREMMRSRFQRAVWAVVEFHGYDVEDNDRVEEARETFLNSSIDFWYLDYPTSALRRISSLQVDVLDEFFELSRDVVRQVGNWRTELLAMPPERRRPASQRPENMVSKIISSYAQAWGWPVW